MKARKLSDERLSIVLSEAEGYDWTGGWSLYARLMAAEVISRRAWLSSSPVIVDATPEALLRAMRKRGWA